MASKSYGKAVSARTPDVASLWIIGTAALVVLGIVVLLQATGAVALAMGWWALLIAIPAVLAVGTLEYAKGKPALAVQASEARKR